MDESYSTHPPIDFPPAQRPAVRQDLALLRVAHATWADCQQQWQRLLSEGPALAELAARAPAGQAGEYIKAQWGAYWKTRAPHTPRSRRDQASVLLGRHLQAAMQWAYASGQVDVADLEPALRLLEGGDALQGAGVETLALALPGGTSLELAGALVLGADKPLLYLPSQAGALQVFASRAALEAQLRARLAELWPTADETAPSFVYTASAKPLHAALNQAMRVFYRDIRQALREGTTNPRRAPALEALSQRLVATPFFAAPPPLPAWQAAAEAEPVLQLGGLQAGTALPARWAQAAQQRAALEAYLQGDDDGAQRAARLSTLQRHTAALRDARSGAEEGSAALLDRNQLQDLLALRIDTGVPYQRLYTGRLQGVRAELAIQALLLRLVPGEIELLLGYLEAPASAEGVTASNLILTADDEREELLGPLLFECASAGSLWLYWPGTYGGLQRFSSREALQQHAFGLVPGDHWLAIEYAEISGDALDYSLQNQLYACEQQAAIVLALGGDAAAQASELQRLQRQAMDDWNVPEPQARDLALAEALEQEQGARVAAAMPGWLRGQAGPQRQQLLALAHDYQRASARALTLLAQALPERQAFAEHAVQALLRQRFSGEAGYRVVLDLPESVTVQRQASGDPALGFTVEKDVKVPSTQRVKVTLVELALDNIDGPTLDRLQFMNVEVSGGNAAGRALRRAAIDIAWLKQYVEDLDLAGAYEQRLRSAFVGGSDEPAFVAAYRRESLVEPFRLILKLQTQRFAQRHTENAEAARLVETATDAKSAAQWQANGQRIVLRAATFTVGGSDTGGQGTTLSGVSFIEEQVSGLTVLVLPDCPDHPWLRRYPSLQAAREGLFDLCMNDNFARYLTGRALTGDPAAHRSRLATAHGRHFSAMIGAGAGWPPTTSLAEHLLDAHMGRLIQAHRDSSRSNAALYLEQVALGNAMVLVYIKMAMGVLPFVGTAVALHDAWQSANAAVEAFLNKGTGEGLLEIRNVLLALMDAAMDLLPGGAVATPSAARGLVRQRQLQRLGSGLAALQPGPDNRRAAQAFEGYQYDRDVHLSPLERGTHGLYRNVYRHADGDFMVREGRIFAIELADSPRTWRLRGNAMKTYKQPIALDELGEWQSHGTLYGTLVNGGLAGGGGVLGHLADGIDPYWPAAIRERLPRWWGDRLFRQQQRLLEQSQLAADRLDAQVWQTNELQKQTPREAYALMQKPFARDMEVAIEAFSDMQASLAVAHGVKRRSIAFNLSRAAMIVTDRSLRRALIGKQKITGLQNEILKQGETLVAAAVDTTVLAERLYTLGLLRERIVLELDAIEIGFTRSQQWYPKLTANEHRAKLGGYYNEFNESFSLVAHGCSRTINVVEVLCRYRSGMDLDGWLLFGIRARPANQRVLRALLAHRDLLDVRGTVAQRRRILEQCIEDYSQFRHQLRIWEAGDGEFIDSGYFESTLAALQRNIDDARAWLGKLPEQTAKPAAGAISRRIFETVDERLLVGVEVPASGSTPAQFKITAPGGIEEVYVQGEAGRWRLQASPQAGLPPPAVTLKQLKRGAQARLDRLPAYRAKVDGYARLGMTGKNLEDMLGDEARELAHLAREIAKREAGAELVGKLNAAAASLHAAGRTLRVDAALATRQPTEGDLDYLLGLGAVEVRKVGAVVELRKRPDGRRDFMQEYEVRRLAPVGVLWYAHFHYEQALPRGFDTYIRAHLKTVEERYVGRQWQAQAGAAEPWRGEIGKRVAEAHFKAL